MMTICFWVWSLHRRRRPLQTSAIIAGTHQKTSEMTLVAGLTVSARTLFWFGETEQVPTLKKMQ